MCQGLVQAQAEGALALPHLARDVVAAAQLVREAVAVGVVKTQITIQQ